MLAHVRSLTALSILILTFALLPQAAEAAEIRGGVGPTLRAACQANGDGGKDDCIRHKHHKALADHELSRDEKLTVRADLHPSLHNRNLRSEVQIRTLDASGKPNGPWITQGTFTWKSTKGVAPTVRKNFTVCAPEKIGLYQVRKKITVAKGSGAPRDLKSGLRSSLRSSSTTSTSSSTTFASNGTSCTTTPADDDLIESFNNMNFSQLAEIVMTSTGASQGTFLLSCPDDQLSNPDFLLTMKTPDGATSSTCSSGGQAPTPIDSSNTACPNEVCTFEIVFSNRTSGLIYSETTITITRPWAANTTLNPELEAATLPACSNNINPCLSPGACSESAESIGSIPLCESATSCNQL